MSIMALCLSLIHTHTQLDDLPAFLKPKDSENTVHIQVHYHKKAKEKSDIFSSIAKRSPSIFRKTKTDSPVITSLPPTAIPLTPPSSPPPGSKTYPGQRSKSLSPKSPLLLSTQSPHQARPLPSLGASLSPKRAADVKFRLSPIHGNSNSVSMDEPSSLSATPGSPQVSSRLTSNHRSRSTNTLFAPGPLTVQQRSSSSNNLHTTSPLTESKRQHGLLSIADVRGLNTEQEMTVTEIGVMDLYILQSVSDFYHQLCVAWDNWNIVSYSHWYYNCLVVHLYRTNCVTLRTPRSIQNHHYYKGMCLLYIHTTYFVHSVMCLGTTSLSSTYL